MVGVGWGLVNCTMKRGGGTAPVRSCLRVTVEPFACLTGLGVPAMVLCLLKCQTPLNDPVPLLERGMVGADDVVECHGSVSVGDF